MHNSSLDLSTEQEAAVEAIGEWLEGPGKNWRQPVFRLFGPAGSGKTTLVRAVIERHDDALLAAFAGKAAYVLGQRVGSPAQTLHSLIYYPAQCPGPKGAATLCSHRKDGPHVSFTVNHGSPLESAEFLIVDECSMVDGLLGQDVLSFGKPVLALGDPFQLPPPEGCGFFTNAEPDVLLTEIHRQEEGGEVLDLATAIRTGQDYSESPCLADDHTVIEEFEMDVAICGTNRTRTRMNRFVRGGKGYLAELPEPGEKVVCLQNSATLNLLNGQMLDVVESVPKDGHNYTAYLRDPLTERRYTVPATSTDLHRESPSIPYTPELARLTFGYAMTCHKAQGSEWDRVLVIDEWKWENRERWLYTAVTRASEQVRVVSRR
jgi:exodeoxyribonuclease V